MSAEDTAQLGDPDIMNDPAFDPGRNGRRKKSVDEPDTCRICRAEGSDDEPLFYPCKCSGSIKFVHQNCLMEWLSHSQKKHCELCKTPFRFTKLYHPHMPAAVPPLVFLRQVVIHTGKSLIAWSRMQLVVFVWLCWLPWAMRNVWRGLFYIGDGGWFNRAQMEQEALRAAKENLDRLAAEGTSPAPHKLLLSGEYTASAVMSRLADAFPHMVSRTLNLTTGEPTVFRLARGLIRTLLGGSQGNPTASISRGSTANASHIPPLSYRSSWLSEVGFLKNLTRFSILNNVLIDTLEGQLITLFIVIAFILVFLIREWVIQQQPGLNVPLAIEGQAPMPAIEDAEPPIQADHELENDARDDINATADAPQGQNDEASPPEVETATHSSNQETPGYRTETNDPAERDRPTQLSSDAQENLAGRPGSSNMQPRPGMPDRGTLARAAEIRRTMEEQSRAKGQDWPGLKIFMELWTRAGNNPMEVLRIIEDEGRAEELGWVIAAMGRLENTTIPAADQHHPGVGTDEDQPHDSGVLASRMDVSEDEAAIAHLARRTFESGYDLSEGLDAVNNHDVGPNNVERGPSVPVLKPDDAPTASVRAVEDLEIRGHTDDDASNQSVGPASGADGHSPDLPTQATNNPFHPDYAGPLPPPAQGSTVSGQSNLAESPEGSEVEAVVQNQAAEAPASQGTATDAGLKQSLVERTMTWLWGESRPNTDAHAMQAAADDEHVVQDLANEAPFVPVEHGQFMLDEHGQFMLDEHDANGDANEAQGPVQDGRVAAEAIQAGIDPNEVEAVEEVEDLEGVMELVGMQGPIAGLIQNGMFCAVLVALTIVFAIWIPYIMGKMFLIILANPLSLLVKMPLRWSSSSADFLSDTFVFAVTCTYYWVAKTVSFLCSPAKKLPLLSRLLYGEEMLADVAKRYAEKSLGRLTDAFLATTDSLSDSDIPAFSIVAHESLRTLQQRVSGAIDMVIYSAIAVCGSETYIYLPEWPGHREFTASMARKTTLCSEAISVWIQTPNAVSSWLMSLKDIDLMRLNVGIPQRTQPLDFSLAYWDTKDRALAIVFGYLFFAVLGMLYLRFSQLFQSKRETGKVRGVVADVLYQAGGVMKVILIISIEMIVFPLYCGLLLDVALLPLFRNATVLSRLEFMVNSPYTSLFVHWFVGTCYMFHFALFVSMCRRIMRTGVLFFIRDPDDPTFHPVRDVLERSVFTQLCKIAFSALVYGGLVIVCLGGVVWGISSACEGVFPIHWSSNEPVLEFPVDLLFYNFLMPLAVKVLRPSDGLTKMYAWWFRRCARALRLSHFLFGDKRADEEGYHVRRKWSDVLTGRGGVYTRNPVIRVIGDDGQQLAEHGQFDTSFLQDGRYVRTPASDQVRIPKDAHTFLDVDEAGNRLDGQADHDHGLHGRQNDQFSVIYIPPHFRLRIGAFIFLLWLFAAATGVSLTVIPLVLGRYVFTHVFPSHPRMNDVYAFSIGINVLGGLGFVFLNAKPMLSHVRGSLVLSRKSDAISVLRKAAHYALRLVRVLYTYTAFAFLLPSLAALVMELYLIVPLHTYFGKGIADHHTIFFIQDWTLGVLCVKMAARFVLWDEHSRPAIALRNVVKDGWTNPDVRLATRGFIFPATVLMSILLLAPLGLGALVNASLSDAEADWKSAVYRYSYPGILALGIAAVVLDYSARAFTGWKRRIRDEVYLIGERLHNFGERRTVNAVSGTRVGM
ncbi:MAG: hypothetical protein LQ346_007569 [Caloplaca aetnensis]|nr:MAG: hypothetical protein LQ346_007569 [Caloplaca aetnensis]